MAKRMGMKLTPKVPVNIGAVPKYDRDEQIKKFDMA